MELLTPFSPHWGMEIGMSAIDWSDVGNLEFDPNCLYAGDEIVFVGDSPYDTKLVVAKQKAGTHYPLTCADNGWCDGKPTVRNKPKRVTLEECWVIYTAEGVQYASTAITDLASEYKKKGFIIRHIPAETVEV